MIFFNPKWSQKQSKQPQRAHIRLESLEDRISPAVLSVDDDLAQNPDANFQTIQEAINASAPGDEIHVSAGTYTEALSFVGTNKSNIELLAVNGQSQTVIQAPDNLKGSVVSINGSQNILVEGFTIDGGGNANQSILAGVEIVGGGDVTLRTNTIKGLDGGGGANTGFGVKIGGNAENGTAEIVFNTIKEYQKGGVFVQNDGSSAVIRQNQITGLGPTTQIAQNGIEVRSGATAQILFNSVQANEFTGSGFSSAGILLFDLPMQVLVQGNTSSSNDVGIFLELADNNLVVGNVSRDNSEFGLALVDAIGNRIFLNQTIANGFSGIALFEASNNFLFGNTSINNNSDGLFLQNSNDNIIQSNRLLSNDGNGLSLLSSEENTIQNNVLDNNVLNGLLLVDSQDNDLISNIFGSNGGMM